MCSNKIVYIIIVTFNAMKYIDRCFSSLKNVPDLWRVIIVDNASQDGCIDRIRNILPQAIFFEQKNNLGFGKANNIGIQYAIEKKADYVFLLNQDAWISIDSLSELVSILGESDKFGVVSPAHWDASGARLDSKFKTYCADIQCTIIEDGLIGRYKNIYDVKFVNAALWLIKYECLCILKGFDPFFLHYGEDEEFVCRLKSLGYKIGICPHIKAYHDRNERSSIDEDVLRQMARCLMSIHERPNLRWLYYFIFCINFMLKFCKELILGTPQGCRAYKKVLLHLYKYFPIIFRYKK